MMTKTNKITRDDDNTSNQKSDKDYAMTNKENDRKTNFDDDEAQNFDNF